MHVNSPGLAKYGYPVQKEARGTARGVSARARAQWLRSAAPANARDWPQPVQAARNHIVHEVKQHLVQHLTGSTLEGVEVNLPVVLHSLVPIALGVVI